MPSEPTSRATRVTSVGERRELVDHRVDRPLQREELADRRRRRSSARGRPSRPRSSRRPCCAPDRSGSAPSGSRCRSARARRRRRPAPRAWPPSRPSTPTSRATRVTSSANDESWSTIVLIVSASSATSPFACTVILRLRSPRATAVVTSAMLRTCVVRLFAIEFTLSVSAFHVPRHVRHVGLAAEHALGADLACDAGHLVGEHAQRVDHRVDRVGERGDLAARLDRELLVQVAVGDSRHDLGDPAHLRRQVRRHEVHVVGQVLPRAADALHLRLAAELALGADLAGDARHLVGERRELVDHRVDRVLEAQDLALRVDGDLARQVALFAT